MPVDHRSHLNQQYRLAMQSQMEKKDVVAGIMLVIMAQETPVLATNRGRDHADQVCVE
jgi:hypothetical protein